MYGWLMVAYLNNANKCDTSSTWGGIFVNRFHLRHKNDLIYPAESRFRGQKQGSIDYPIAKLINTGPVNYTK